MKNIKELDIENNILLKEFLRAGDLSEAGLKKAYRKLCFSVHPDTADNNSYDFISLKKDYQEILESFDSIAKQLYTIREKNIHYTFHDLRTDLYSALRKYISLGIHSPRVRIREELKKRNELVINHLLVLAKRYDPELHDSLVIFNNITFHNFESMRIERMNKKLKQKLLTGISNAYDYIVYNKKESIRRTAISYFKDIKYLPIPDNEYGQIVWKLSDWFFRDLSVKD